MTIKRIINQPLLDSYKLKRCVIFECKSRTKIVGHHIKSVGARGDDVPDNLMPLCVEHHNEIHHGRSTFISNYKLENYIERKNWEQCPLTLKWYNPNV